MSRRRRSGEIVRCCNKHSIFSHLRGCDICQLLEVEARVAKWKEYKESYGPLSNGDYQWLLARIEELEIEIAKLKEEE